MQDRQGRQAERIDAMGAQLKTLANGCGTLPRSDAKLHDTRVASLTESNRRLHLENLEWQRKYQIMASKHAEAQRMLRESEQLQADQVTHHHHYHAATSDVHIGGADDDCHMAWERAKSRHPVLQERKAERRRKINRRYPYNG
jgi:hypothetical protein